MKDGPPFTFSVNHLPKLSVGCPIPVAAGKRFPQARRTMAWKECHVIDERLRFVARLLEGEKDGLMPLTNTNSPSDAQSRPDTNVESRDNTCRVGPARTTMC